MHDSFLITHLKLYTEVFYFGKLHLVFPKVSLLDRCPFQVEVMTSCDVSERSKQRTGPVFWFVSFQGRKAGALQARVGKDFECSETQVRTEVEVNDLIEMKGEAYCVQWLFLKMNCGGVFCCFFFSFFFAVPVAI